MTEPLDIRPADVRLARIVDALTGLALLPRMLREGDEVADEWRGRVSAAGLVDTGRYRDSLHSVRKAAGKKRVTVSVETSRDAYYARFQEYGTRHVMREDVGRETFGAKKDDVVEGMRDEVERRVRTIIGAGI